MDSNRLAELIIHPSSCTREELPELIALAGKYPYSTALHVLNARIAAMQNLDSRDTLLTRAAISSPDRMRLKLYMTTDDVYAGHDFAKTRKQETGTTVETAVADNLPGDPAENEQQSRITEPAERSEEKKQDQKINTDRIPAATENQSETKSEKKSEAISGDDIRDMKSPKQSELADELMANIANYRKALENFNRLFPDEPEVKTPDDRALPPTETIPDTPARTSEEAPVEPSTGTSPDTPAEESPETPVTPSLKTSAEEPVEPSAGKYPEKPAGTTAEKPEDTPAPEQGTEDIDEKFREIIKPRQKKKSGRKLPKEEQDHLINKFIETDSDSQNSLKTGNKKNSTDEDLSLPSSELNDDMVTETLANILVNQGKLEKAIDIYRKLIWKLPQKKAYFAARIESLKERISKK